MDMIRFTPEDIYLLIGFVSLSLGLYGRFKGDIVSAEKRLTIIEKDIENLEEFKRSATLRLDNHDKQNEALIQMKTSLEYLTEKVDAIDKRLE